MNAVVKSKQDKINIIIDGRLNKWCFNEIKPEYLLEFKITFEEYSIAPFESFSDFMNQFLSTAENEELLIEFNNKLKMDDVKSNCPLLKDILVDIEKSQLNTDDLSELISIYPMRSIFFFTDDLKITFKRNDVIILEKSIGEIFEGERNYFMEEFDGSEPEFISVRNRLKEIYSKSSDCFELHSEADFLFEAVYSKSICEKLENVVFCPSELNRMSLNYNADNSFSIRTDLRRAVISIDFETDNFNLDNLMFLPLNFSKYHNDYWSLHDAYSFSEIFYNDNLLDKTYEIIDEGGFRFYFDGDESNIEARFNCILGIED